MSLAALYERQAGAEGSRVTAAATVRRPPGSPDRPIPNALALTPDLAGAGTSQPAGTPVVVRADGKFELPVQLAPWPQDVAVQDVDAGGNESNG